MRVVGTAGHVDHGKSTLIQALTGIDPDRLAEEKERGMTIDLGFAWLKLPSGQEVSIVDVPGHERFIHNMLAGVGGIDIALLVVAADEGVMPQTREHLDILDLLAIPSGAIMVTKVDLTSWGKYLWAGGLAAIGVIVCAILFNFELGVWFSGLMIALASMYILYDTSNVLRTYRTDQYVAASLALFASVALLFWYILRLFIQLRRN